MMKRSSFIYDPASRDIVFMPALTPLEAAVLPARERRAYGALHHAKESFAFGRAADRMRPAYRLKLCGWGNQRQKI